MSEDRSGSQYQHGTMPSTKAHSNLALAGVLVEEKQQDIHKIWDGKRLSL